MSNSISRREALKTLGGLSVGVLLGGCADLVQPDPNRRMVADFWKTEEHARQGLVAAYNGLRGGGTYKSRLYLPYVGRSDLTTSRSANSNVTSLCEFTFVSYDHPMNNAVWDDHYHGIYRANQVIAYVPEIDMNSELQRRIVAEARFLRALLYYNLVVLYENIPLVLKPVDPEDRPAQVGPEEGWAQIEKDLKAAQEVLPVEYSSDLAGHATKGAATALLGKAYLQQRKWSQAAGVFEQVISSSAGYNLFENYAENFDGTEENGVESIFEVQFVERPPEGCGIPRLNGPAQVCFVETQPSRWFFDQFFKEKTVDGETDPRLDATIFYNKAGGMDVYGIPYAERYGEDSDILYWKKHTQYWQEEQTWDSSLNFKVIRFADVLLMHAEALNEAGRTAEAYAPINRVRARVNLPSLEPGLSQAKMREKIAHERLLELGAEFGRFPYLKRHGLLSTDLAAHDPEFEFFDKGTDERLPIPQMEVDMNPNVKQNPGY